MTQQTTINWLKAGAALMIIFGFICFIGLIQNFSGPANFLIDLAIWPIDGAQSLSSPEVKLLMAIFAGLMVGWGIMIWLIATKLYNHDRALARTLILTSIGAWFIIDSAGSIMAGAPINAALNIGFLLLFFIPLWKAEAAPKA